MQRDGPAGGSKSFRLPSVEFGRDNDGDPVTSCVVEWTDPPERDETGNKRLALDVLKQILETEGRDDDKRGRVIDRERWRAACKEAKLAGMNPISCREAFLRAEKALTAETGRCSPRVGMCGSSDGCSRWRSRF